MGSGLILSEEGGVVLLKVLVVAPSGVFTDEPVHGSIDLKYIYIK
jgi:hypothetical protein